MKKLLTICVASLLVAIQAKAQLNFLFIPEVAGRSVDGLGSFRIQNLSGAPSFGSVEIIVTETTTRQRILNITTPEFSVATGSSQFPLTAFKGSKFVFANNAFASVLSQTRNFPPGNYSYCFQFKTQHNSVESEDCFDAEILPLVPISLISPADKDRICQKRPVLSWQPPLPFHPSMKFRLLLTEKTNGSSVESLLMNAPLLLLDNISGTTINYPSNRPELQEGKTYCWQVIAMQQGMLISKSEIWEFTVECKEPAKSKPFDSYRELKSMVNSNYYIANRIFKFSLYNAYNIKKLNYTVLDMADGSKPMKDLPEVPLIIGLNKIDIDLTEAGLEPGKQYLLKVYPHNETAVIIRFVYEDKDETE
ncbi:hypothetical protein HHL16_10345 [Pseudoflavitalea sp. G-6-1-2]|uniref:hypothetical protein n=1 Tax=Pseudoflavitalea sp. G-6-1-2 TaxID=2728841 RepID=UPI00146DDD10|nr:hypothetical protein [Pseudoflavitalea sp. G-6-1-2]NML21274.1 hypothetical protein [Pseudoflavitalea sp. G-6-1-2]